MGNAVNPFLPFPIGSTLGVSATTDGNEWEGMEYEVPDLDYSTSPPTVRAYHAVGGNCAPRKRIRVVRNVSGIALLPRYAVQFQATNYGRRIIGYGSLTAGEVYPVDEFLPTAGVANNDLFYITVDGCAEMLTSTLADDGNSIAQGGILVGVTATASTFSTSAGRVAAQATTGATNVLMLQVMNAIGVALTARTTANTTGATARILVHVKRW